MFKLFIGLAILAYAAYASPKTNGNSMELTESQHQRIVRGKNAPHHIPYIVSLRNKTDKDHSCGGAILNENWILTAGHCVESKIVENYQIYAGNNSLPDQTDVYDIEKIILPKNYINFYKDDIALIKVASPIKIDGRKIKSIAMESEFVKAGGKVDICGWGRLSLTELIYPTYLQCLEQKALSNAKCNTRNHICASRKDKGIPFKGDSGGPLVRNGKVIGITSFVYPPKKLAVYTRVSSYYSWVNKEMASN